MTEQQAIEFAQNKHPECAFAKTDYGLSAMFEPTWVVQLWREEALYWADDPPRHIVQGIPRG